MQNAKLRKGSTAIYYEQQRSFQSCNNKHAHLHVYWCVCVCDKPANTSVRCAPYNAAYD